MLRYRLISAAAFLAGLALWTVPAAAQLPSNATIKGAYYFRYLGDNTTTSDTALAYQGTITFDGTSDSNGEGTFTVTGSGTTGVTPGPAANNVYSMYSSGGLVYFNNPFDTTGSTFFYGGVGANGVIVASSTDSFYADLIVAVPVGTATSNATLSGTYYLSSFDWLGGDFNKTRDTFFSMTADGKGSLGNVTVKGTALNLNGAAQVQTSSGATYNVTANGSGTMTFPAPSGLNADNVLLSGAKVLYVSSDGNFFIAGGATSYDMILGVKAFAGTVTTSSLQGLTYTGYLQDYEVGSGSDGVYAEDGTSNISGTVEVGHQRTNYEGYPSYDYTFAFPFQLGADGTYTDNSSTSYVLGNGGNILIGAGVGNVYQLIAYVKAPTLTGTGVFLNPQGIVNAASSVPFTALVAPGEVISLYGTNLAGTATTTPGLPFPNTLSGASVTISYVDSNGATQKVNAPIYYASPTLISCVVPYSIPGDDYPLLTIQVTNNGTASNTATVFAGPSSPGIFTVPTGGVGNGAMLHLDYSLVTPANPAKVGEIVQVYLTGLGGVSPAATAGAAGPTSPLSNAVLPDVYIDGIQATVSFAGLAPTYGGLYQMNITVPAGVTTGANDYIEIDAYDSSDSFVGYNIQATIPIAK